MGRRPRSHQLETASVRAFVDLLPSAWTVEPFQNDYGLDLRIEVFTEFGRSTGIQFYAQVKGTDVTDLKQALAVRVTRGQFEYWTQQANPVLLVLWHSPTQVCYRTWTHHFHPFPGRPHAKTKTIRLQPHMNWNPADIQDLVVEVDYVRQVGHGVLSLPIEVNVQPSPKRLLPRDAFDESVRGIRQVVPDADITLLDGRLRPGVGNVYLGRDYVEAQVGRGTFSFFRERGRTDPPPPAAGDVACAVGLAAAHSGALASGLALLGRYGPSSGYLAAEATSGGALVTLLMRSRQYETGLELAEAWKANTSQPVYTEGAIAVLSFLSIMAVDAPRETRERASALLAREIPDEVFAKMTLSTGQVLESFGRHGQARRLYVHALDTSGGIASGESELLRRIASTSLDLDDIDRAFNSYAELVRREPTDSEAREGLAFSLMMLGEYSDALAVYASMGDPYYHGRRVAGMGWASAAALALGLDLDHPPWSQKRRPQDASNISRQVNPGASTGSLLSSFFEAAAVDAAAADTWRLYFAVALQESDAAPFGALGLLALASAASYDVEWWALVAIQAERMANPMAAMTAIEAGLECHGDAFVRELERLSSVQDGSTASSARVAAQIYELKQDGYWIDRVHPNETELPGDHSTNFVFQPRSDPVPAVVFDLSPDPSDPATGD